MQSEPITFSLADTSPGYPCSRDRIRLRTLSEFVKEVEVFLRGERREVDPAGLDVSLCSGALAIETAPIPVFAAVFKDLRQLAVGQVLDGLDRRRRQMIERWQDRARAHRGNAVRITSPALHKPVTIRGRSDFRSNDADRWVRVERYVKGEIQDLGGATRTNAHVRLPDGTTLRVAAERDTLRLETENRLYKPAMLRIQARLNMDTGEIADASLLEFVAHAPQADEDLAELRRKGALAWKDAGDTAQWLQALREGDLR